MDHIRKCSESIKKSTVEQTATMRAWSEQNSLNVAKFRKQVEDELDATNKKKENQDNKGF